jgi:hypothetical protein
MKNPKHLSLLALLFLLSACLKKEDPPPIPILIGEGTGVVNGNSIPFKTYAVKVSGDQLIRLEIDGRDVQNHRDYNISFSNIPLELGVVNSIHNISYPNQSNSSYCSYTVANGDVIYAFYNLIENHPANHFKITEIDEKTQLVKGVFDITLVIDPVFDNSEALFLADTIRLRAGSFEAPLRE